MEREAQAPAGQARAEPAAAAPGTPVMGRPLKLPCGAVLANRLAKAALTEGLADADNRATPAHAALYRRWSEGGSALVITGNVQVDRRYLERPGNLAVDGNDGLGALAAYARAGTRAGNHLWMQINHPGRQTLARIHAHPPAPSAIALALPGFGQPHAMSDAQILDVIQRFASVATVARHSGFTGVQIHAAHGYLLSQFLSPRANRRTDRWGGSLSNRARALLETVRAVRAAVGPHFPVAVKLNSADFQQGGFTHEESVQVARWLQESGVDLLEVSGGTYEQPEMVVAARAGHTHEARDSTVRREAYFLDYAAAIRAATTLPLMVTGGFRTRAAIEAALQGGALDVIGLGRPLITDPDAACKLLNAQIDTLPAYERTLKLSTADAQAQLAPDVLSEARGWGIQGWFCVQMLRLGWGLEPDTGMTVLDAFLQYRAHEHSAVQDLTSR